MNIWFFSDPHWNHKNIVKGESSWEDKNECRNFDTLEEHNEVVVNNINSVIKENDIAYCLGDWSFGGKDSVFEFRKQLNCKNIHLIFGNHDIHIKKNYNECQRLFVSCNDILHKKIGNENFVLCHYSMRTWDRAHHGSIHLYGHSHGTLPDYQKIMEKQIYDEGELIKTINESIKFKSMDVGMDTHPEFRPYSYDEIIKEMSLRVPLRVDHHSELTN